MSRFTRFSRISPLELCLEAERRAWRCGAAVLLLLPALALAAVWVPVPETFAPGGNETQFSGIAVTETGPAQKKSAEVVAPALLPPSPAAELVPEVALVAEVQPLPVEEWEPQAVVMEPFEAEPLLALEVPERFAAPAPPRRAEDAAPKAPAASPPSAASAETSGELVAASYRSTPRPPYPPTLLNRRVQGCVGLRVSVDVDGVPSSVEVATSSGPAAFDCGAREWVLAHWRFHPARRGGVPVASVVRTQVEFVLR